ncbi:hypothetical protein BGZ76_008799 [Entomortierella beljakovae]|nr:hypothetical protein BGZ76_008799 [Entomortierella beljakovae]
MSVGGPLFLAQLGSTKKTKTEPRTVPTILVLLILLGEISVIMTPFFETMSTGFKWNLILTHALFFIPCIITFNPESQKRFSTFSLPLFYFLLSLIGLFHHLMYSLPFVFSPIMRPIILYNALWFNHCQTSISADLIFNNILAAVFIIQSSRQLRRTHVGAILILLMPVLSVSTILPLYLGWKERQLSAEESSKEKKAK